MKKEMIKERFAREKIVVTGNPYFDTFRKIKDREANYVVFIDQPFSEISGARIKEKSSSFNEVKIFSDIVAIMEKLDLENPVIISLHPRTAKKDKYAELIKKSRLKISISGKNSENLIKKAKIVIGINSMVLFEAAIRGKKVISYQPGLKKVEDRLMSNRLNLSAKAYNIKELERKIKNLVSHEKSVNRKSKIYLNQNFTGKVISLMNKIK
jgi:UDP-N-acetylglucosamine 2-epimerase